MKSKIYAVLFKATRQVFETEANNLEMTKFRLIMDLGLSGATPQDRYYVQQTILEINDQANLQKYICNALLKYEGMGLRK
jgi:hypothetical protein